MINRWLESFCASRCLTVSAGANCLSFVVTPLVVARSSGLLAAVCMKGFANFFLRLCGNRLRAFPQKLKGQAQTLRQLRVADNQRPGLLARSEERRVGK